MPDKIIGFSKLSRDKKISWISKNFLDNSNEFESILNKFLNNDKKIHTLKKYQKGQVIKVKILEIDPEKEKISFGFTHLLIKPVLVKRGCFRPYQKNK